MDNWDHVLKIGIRFISWVLFDHDLRLAVLGCVLLCRAFPVKVLCSACSLSG